MNMALPLSLGEGAPAAKGPPLVLLDSEADALFELALMWQRQHPHSADLLIEELDRAETVARDALPPDVVTMRSQVVFVDRASGERHAVRLVYPREADMEQHQVSILTPIGAALIGMRVGNSIDWPNRQGERRELEIVEVVQPGADAGA